MTTNIQQCKARCEATGGQTYSPAGANWVGYIVLFALIIILGIVFTVDDATVIGEFLDPLEFIVLGAIGFFGGKKLK